VNVSHLTGHQREAAIAVDPADPQRLFAVSNTRVGGALFAAYSTDGGSSWAYADPSDGAIADSHDSLVQACCDPTAAFDEYGNLFLGYLSENSPQTVELALSTDGGQAFTRLAEFPRGRLGTDQPTVVTGPDGTGQQSVWVTFRDNDTPQVMVYGAQVTGLNVVGSFAGFGLGPASRTGNFGDIAVGPSGQVLVAYQSTGSRGPYTISANLKPDGLAGAVAFGGQITVASTNLGDNDLITPQPDRGVDAEVGLAWDRNPSSRNFGRVYLVSTDEVPSESSNTDIFVSFSDDDGASWNSPVRVNDDGATNSQFLPRIAVDQTTGFVGVSWYDARNSPDNSTAKFFGAISFDGGLTFGTNFRISTGTSNQAPAGGPGDLDYGDYTGLAFHDGGLHPVWADNSNSSGDNPDGNAFDV